MRLRFVASIRVSIPLASFLILLSTTGAEAASRKSPRTSAPASRTSNLHPPALFDDASTRSDLEELDRLLEDRPIPASWANQPASARLEAAATSDSIIDLNPSTPLARLESVAKPYLGTRYRTGGEDGNGFDCSGFVLRIVSFFGVELPGRSSPSYWKQGEPVDKDSLQAGDLVFFSDHTRSIGHVGIYLENGTFVHASVQSGVVISRLDEKYYKRRYKGARRIPELSEALVSPQGTLAYR